MRLLKIGWITFAFGALLLAACCFVGGMGPCGPSNAFGLVLLFGGLILALGGAVISVAGLITAAANKLGR